MNQQLKKKAYRILLSAVVIIGISAALTACSKKTESKADNQTSKNLNEAGDLVIPVSEISETANFYPVNVDGKDMEVLAVKAPDGTIRTAFNTCQICYSSGRGYYKQQGDLLVCQNCGNRFSMDLVEVESGGCNPWPIFDKDKTATDESITIPSDFLKESEQIFANWKTTY